MTAQVFAATRTGTRSGFYLAAHGFLLVIVLVGFAPSFYLRAGFHADDLPASLVLHGVLLTSWFAIAPAQAWLVRSGRMAWHKSVGIVAAIVAGAIVVSSAIVNTRFAMTLSPEDPFVVIVWGNYLTLPVFAGFVTAAIHLRRRAEYHKRLMLLASISLVGPALGRMPTWPIFGAGAGTAGNFAAGGTLLLIGVMILNDLLLERSVHRATWIGIATLVLSAVAAVVPGLSQVGLDLLRTLA